jgi:hypothetical protein
VPSPSWPAYGWRFKIEVSFRALVERMFAFCSRFWRKAQEKRQWGAGTQYLHRAGASHWAQVARNLEAYERLCSRCGMQAEMGVILAANDPNSLLAKTLATRSREALPPHPLKLAA